MQLRRPFAFELLACQGQAFVGGLRIAQGGAGENYAENARHHSRCERNVVYESGNRDGHRDDPLHRHRTFAPDRAATGCFTDNLRRGSSPTECSESFTIAPDAHGTEPSILEVHSLW